jgi:hypothetical protein
MEEKKNPDRVSVGKCEGNRPLGQPRHGQENNIKTDLKEIGWKKMDCIQLAQDWNKWQALVNTVSTKVSIYKTMQCHIPNNQSANISTNSLNNIAYLPQTMQHTRGQLLCLLCTMCTTRMYMRMVMLLPPVNRRIAG